MAVSVASHYACCKCWQSYIATWSQQLILETASQCTILAVEEKWREISKSRPKCKYSQGGEWEAILLHSFHFIHLYFLDVTAAELKFRCLDSNPDPTTQTQALAILHTSQSAFCKYVHILPFPCVLRSKFIQFETCGSIVISHDTTSSPNFITINNCMWDLFSSRTAP